jgi:hypothetical protein
MIDLDEELKLSRFRRIMALIPSSNVIKVYVNGRHHDIGKIIDKKDVTILEIAD